MLAITLAIYLGYTTVEKTVGWREKNVKYVHLIAGLALILLGVLMLLGLI